MARPSWLVDSNRIATKIMSASGASDPQEVNWKSNPSKECPNCQHTIDNSDTTQEWPGLPRGVKFDPSDQEIIWHLLAKVGVGSLKPHPFIDEFVPTVNEDDGICYTHPQNLPGVKQDGSVSHFFHRAIKAYNTGTRKRRKIHGESFGDVRWHKTGRTKPVFLDGTQQGCKKIMVLYVSPVKGGGKPEKTSWVMHQYHLGTQEDEREGEYVISKVFYQQSQLKLSEKNELEVPEDVDSVIVKADPVTPKLVTPEPPSTGKRLLNFDAGQAVVDPYIQHHDEEYMEDEVEVEPQSTVKLLLNYDAEQVLVVPPAQYHNEEYMEDEVEAPKEQQLLYCEDHITLEDQNNEMEEKNEHGEEPKLGDSELQYLLDSQQLVEGLSLCDELLQSQSPIRDGNIIDQELKSKPRLSDYAHLGKESWKKDLEECQNLDFDPPQNADNDADDLRLSQLVGSSDAADSRLSQLEFVSQDSYVSWGGSKLNFEAGDHQGC